MMNEKFREYKQEMVDFLQNRYPSGIQSQSNIQAVDFYFVDEPTEFTSVMYEPSLCLILQGSKSVDFGDKLYEYNDKEYLLASTHLPAKVKVLKATKQIPYISLRIKFSLEEIYEVLKERKDKRYSHAKTVEKGLFFDEMNMKLYSAIRRLVKLLDEPKEEMQFISKLIIKEILYILISNEKSGHFLHNFIMEGSISNKVVTAITEIKNSFNQKLNMRELADKIHMSESSFYQYFKTITSMSPVQFQKKLRLEEAKNMLIAKNIEVNEVAFAVGYESPSQFSREYSRMYGMSPKAHSEYLRSL
jgi:AraC-like DNA-binding protein